MNVIVGVLRDLFWIVMFFAVLFWSFAPGRTSEPHPDILLTNLLLLIALSQLGRIIKLLADQKTQQNNATRESNANRVS